MAVQRSPDIFRQIRQPEESVRLAAVQAKGENIRYVSAPSEAVQLAAVRNDPMNIRYIENPTEKVQSVVLNADRDAAPFISSPTEEIKRLAMEMYGLRLENAAGKEAAAARTSENLRRLRKESGGGRGKETFGKAGQRGGGKTG
ncbi:hypothetical protein AAH018_19690 [Phocaeicola vulgatus]